jgi:hypothetical protein
MRSVPFSQVLDHLCHIIGVDPEDAQLNFLRALASYLTLAVARAWEMDACWPWVAERQMTYRDAWSIVTNYAAGDEVFYEGEYFRAAEPNIGQVPDLSVYWIPITPEPYLTLEQEIGLVLAVMDTFRNERKFLLRGNRVYVADPAPVQTILQYAEEAPEFSAVPWAAGSYAAGAVVLHDGECYKALTTTSNPPPSAEWRRQVFPRILMQYALQEAYALNLEADGQTEKAAVARSYARRALEEEQDRLFIAEANLAEFRIRGEARIPNVTVNLQTVVYKPLLVAPANVSDFSMFPDGNPPSAGQYQVTDGTYIYFYRAGWLTWRRAPIAVWS